MKRYIRFFLPVLVIIIAYITIDYIKNNKPKPVKTKAKKPVLQVEVIKPIITDYEVMLDSYGVIKPYTETTINSEVQGRIIKIAENLKVGAFVKKNQLLVAIDNLNYLTAVKNAKSKLSNANYELLKEKANSEQAILERSKLANIHRNDLALRKPQLQMANDAYEAAKAQLANANKDLENTKIYAPFKGYIINKYVNLGQTITNNSKVLDMFSDSYAEVRLAISIDKIKLIDEKNLKVKIYANNEVWDAKVTHIDKFIDENTQQLFITAKIFNPFNNTDKENLRVGQYVEAKIIGKTLKNVIVIPSVALNQDMTTNIARNGNLVKLAIKPLFQNDKNVVFKKDMIKDGDMIITTPIGNVTSGIQVKVASKNKAK